MVVRKPVYFFNDGIILYDQGVVNEITTSVQRPGLNWMLFTVNIILLDELGILANHSTPWIPLYYVGYSQSFLLIILRVD